MNPTRFIVKKVLSYTWKPLVSIYLSNSRNYHWQNISVNIPHGIFHPGIFFSTHILLSYLSKQELKNKSFLELGSGTGLISVYASRQGAIVTASDINPLAVETTRKNAINNGVRVQVIESDLFDQLTERKFDFIIINPPYYKGSVITDSKSAWYAGDEYQYFEKLFSQLKKHINVESKVVMVLSDECDLVLIKRLAMQYQFELYLSIKIRRWWEINYVFEIANKVPNLL